MSGADACIEVLNRARELGVKHGASNCALSGEIILEFFADEIDAALSEARQTIGIFAQWAKYTPFENDVALLQEMVIDFYKAGLHEST